MNKTYPRVVVKYNTGAKVMRCSLWQARIHHGPDDKDGVYLVGDFGPIDYKWVAKRFLGKYPSAKAPDLRKMLQS
jgi:hypothetical protein